MDNSAMINGDPLLNTAREQSLEHWNAVANAFVAGQFNDGDGVGAWHWIGRTSHLMQDMTAILHVLNFQHLAPSCQFEAFWSDNQALLANTLNPVNGALFSDSPLPAEASARFDAHTTARLQNWHNSVADNANGPVGCPNKGLNDVRGYLEVLSWMTYFRTTFWGEIQLGANNTSATAPMTTQTGFNDGNVGPQVNTLHVMFNGNVRSRITWSDDYYEITDRQNSVFRYMEWGANIDDWSACGQAAPLGWSSGKQDSSLLAEGDDEDDDDARVTGRFWFDARELGKDNNGTLNRRCYPNKYPDGTDMVDDLHEYYGKVLFPLTVRYNAGLIGLANRRATVSVSAGTANVTLSRRDNFATGPNLAASTVGQSLYFLAKSAVTLTAPVQNSLGGTFIYWSRRSGAAQVENKVNNRVITINGAAEPISRYGETLTAVYMGAPGGVAATDGTLLDRVQVTWNGVAGATHYRVYRHTANNSAAAGALGNWQAGTSYNDLTATPGVTYYYWVKAATSAAGANASAFSGSNSGWRKLAVPAGVTAVGAANKVTISWNAVVGASRYRVYRSSNGLLGFWGNAGFVLLATPITGWQAGISFAHTTAAYGQNYYWVQAATDAAGSKPSGYSARVMGFRPFAFIPMLPRNSAGSEAGGTGDTAPGGTPKWWLDYFNLTAGGADDEAIEQSDLDADGMTVREEYVAGTDPTDTASHLAAHMDVASGAGVALHWQGVPGRVYQIMRSSALDASGWERVGDPMTCSDPETLTFTPDPEDSAQQGYYRVGVELESPIENE